MTQYRFVPALPRLAPLLFRAVFQCGLVLRRTWWSIARPRLQSCRVICADRAGRVLLVRHNYGPRCWMLPGGGMKRGEPALTAAARELAEEAGCRIEEAREIATIREFVRGATIDVHLVRGETRDVPLPDRREIAEAEFFPPDALPGDTAPFVRRQLSNHFRAL